MTATTGRSVPAPPASSSPCAMPMDAPMSTHVSMAASGGERRQRVAADVARSRRRPCARSAWKTPRCGQPGHSIGGRGGRSVIGSRVSGADAPNAAATLPGDSSPMCGTPASLDGEAHGPQAQAQVRVELLDDARGGRPWPRTPGCAPRAAGTSCPSLSVGGVGQRLAHVLVDDARGHDAERRVAHLLDGERARLALGARGLPASRRGRRGAAAPSRAS